MSQPSPSHIRATAVRVATLRRLALGVLFTIVTTSYQTTCTVSERTFNKRQHANARYRVESLTLYALRHALFPFGPSLSLFQTAATNPGHGTRFLAALFFCFPRDFWDRISICSCPGLCIGQPQIPCCVRTTGATAKKRLYPRRDPTMCLAALAAERILDRKSASRCVMMTLHLGRDDQGNENAVSPP